ncbi:MAG: hypothetical protein JNN20_16040 [Betaproteobacteria bacterium]|nr:hypothetical protein [Betaproteobacteria bacterium]
MDIFQWIFFGPAKLIAAWPYAGFAIGAVMIAVQAWRHLRLGRAYNQSFFREPAVFAGILWLIFNAYELQVSAIAAKSGDTMLRIDLMVLVPILYVMTTVALVALSKQPGPSPGRAGEEQNKN